MHTLDLWLEGSLAGQLHQGETGLVEFIYNSDYISAAQATPLSISMPIDRLAHGPSVVMPWLENLLPDDPTTRRSWATHFGITQTSAFALLHHMGVDAPGAVQILPNGEAPGQDGHLAGIGEAGMAAKIESLVRSPKVWDHGDSFDRWSLAGGQPKFAVVKTGGDWFEPQGNMPSTHIVKPGMAVASMSNLETQALEYVTMRAANLTGLDVAAVEMLDFDGLPTLVVERFDRLVTPEGTVARVHQEDFCQVLATPPELKYEEHGGPGIAQVSAAIRSHSMRVEDDLRKFAEAVIFNLLTAGTDAHAKNYSVLHSGASTLFAPLYDLISAQGIYYPRSARLRGSSAMSYGNAFQYNYINGESLALTADDLGISRTHFSEIFEAIGARLPKATQEAVNELPPALQTERMMSLPTAFESSATHYSMLAAQSAKLDLPIRKTTGDNRRHAGAETWVAGHERNGVWISGHALKRARPRT